MPEPDTSTGPKLPSKYLRTKKIGTAILMLAFGVLFTLILVSIGKLASFVPLPVSGLVASSKPEEVNPATSGYMENYQPFLIFTDASSLGFLLISVVVSSIITTIIFCSPLTKKALIPITIAGLTVSLFAVSCALETTKQNFDNMNLNTWMSERYGFTPTDGSNSKRLPNDGHLYKDSSTGAIAETKEINGSYYLYDALTGKELPVKPPAPDENNS